MLKQDTALLPAVAAAVGLTALSAFYMMIAANACFTPPKIELSSPPSRLPHSASRPNTFGSTLLIFYLFISEGLTRDAVAPVISSGWDSNSVYRCVTTRSARLNRPWRGESSLASASR